MILLQDYRNSLCYNNTNGQKLDVSIVSKCQVWLAPPPNFIKINWDAALNSSRGCAGFGLVARNCNGNFLSAQCIVHPQNIEAKSAEALAVFWAVRFCMKMDFRETIFEGDAAQVIDDICSPLPHLSKSGHITESIALNILHLTSAKFVHVKREGNMVAHCLAKLAVDQNSSSCWRFEPPACIVDSLVRDRLHL
jgi:ribonuclease HI